MKALNKLTSKLLNPKGTMADEVKETEKTTSTTYRASLSTGVYGFYQVRQFEYKASLSTGVYGSYQIISQSTTTKESKATEEEEEYEYEEITTYSKKKGPFVYSPSISSGIFGTWIYNETSPYTIIEVPKVVKVKKKKSTSTKKRGGMKVSSGYSSYYGRKKKPKEYNFVIEGPRLNEKIVNGKKFNVKLLQEYTLPMGKPLAEKVKQYLAEKKKAKKAKAKQAKDTKDDKDKSDEKEQKNDDNNTSQKPEDDIDDDPTNDLNGMGTLFICEGSVVHFSGECIINAANEGMLGGGGVDGAISSAGGDALYYLRQKEPTVSGSSHVRCRTGDAKITQSGYPHNRLRCDWVIHAVGPNYSSMMYGRGKSSKMDDIDQLLYDSYAKSMILCKQKNIQSVGFCLISSGIFRGSRSLEDVLKFGIEAIRDYMYPGVEVYMIGYQAGELSCLAKLAPKVLGTMTKEYAKVKQSRGWGSGWGGSSWGGGSRWGGRANDSDSDSDDDEGGGGGGMFGGISKLFGGGKKKK